MPSWYDSIPAGEWGTLGSIGAFSASGLSQYSSVDYFNLWTGGVVTPLGVYDGATFVSGPAMVIWGGGHADYSGNEVYAIADLLGTPYYARLRDKTSPDITNTDRDGSNNPVSRHTYQSIWYVPGANNWMLAGGYNFRATDSASGTASDRFNFGQVSPNSNQPWAPTGAAPGGTISGAVDSVNGVIWAYSPSVGGSGNNVCMYTISTDTWSNALFKSPLQGTNACSAVDTTRGLWFTVWQGSTTVQGYRTNNGTSNDYYSVSTTGTAPPSGNNKSIIWDPVDDRFVVWADGGKTLYFLTPPSSSPYQGGNAWVWSSTTPGSGSTPGTGQTNGTFGRFAYVEDTGLRGYLLWNDEGEDPLFFRPASADPNVTLALTGQSMTLTAGDIVQRPGISGDAGSAAQWNAFQQNAVQAYGTDAGGSPDVTVSLTGSAATSAAGSVGVTSTKALTGQSATSAAGTASPSTAKAVTGEVATAAAGTVTQSRTIALAGQGATAAAGTVAPSTTLALSGQSATAAQGSVTTGSDVTAALTGQSATAAAGTLAPSATVALTGSSATAAAGTVTTGSDVTAALTGQSMTASAGSVTQSREVPLSGASATAAAGTMTTGSDVTTALSGQAATATTGVLGVSVTRGITGEAATAAAGTAAPETSKALSGQAATSAAGTVTPSATVGLTGSQATSAAGTLSTAGDKVVALTGVAATASAGTLGLQLGIVLTGAGATSALGSVGINRSIGLSGLSATSAAGSVASSGGVSAVPLPEPRFRNLVRAIAKRIGGKPGAGSGRIGGPIQ